MRSLAAFPTLSDTIPPVVKFTPIDDEHSLPLVVEPEEGEAASADTRTLIEWLKENRGLFDSWLLERGAVLFRGFGVDDPEKFEAATIAVEPELLNYVEGDSPRTKVSGKVYTSTEYPESYQISLHNELSFAHRWPGKIFFCCVVAPPHGGETPIVDCREVFRSLDPRIRDSFAARKVRYVSNAHGGEGIGKSWQDTFETGDRARVEEYLRSAGVEFRWGEDGSLHTSQVREAVISHPVTGETVWFNQAEQWHPSTLDLKNRRAMAALGLKEEELPHYASFGDGSPLDPEDLEEIRALMRDKAVYFPWRQGDMLVCDNVLVAHGRNSFRGPRKILVAMA